MEEETAPLDAVEIFAFDVGGDETLHEETVVLALETKAWEFVVGERDLEGVEIEPGGGEPAW